METRFNCMFESDEKGIYMEVNTEYYTESVGFSFFRDFKPDGEVVIDKGDMENLIAILKNKIEI